MDISGRIGLLRQRLGMSQRVFGEHSGRSAGYVNRIENGKNEPTPEVLTSISTTFGVDMNWLTTGVGVLLVESIGDRVKAARKKREYTQGELARELLISRNSVGMIERGTIRPREEIISTLCDKLWINKNWLLTGQGDMERTELTPFYELLKRDPGVRRHIRSFIRHLDNPRHESQKAREEKEEPVEPDRWVKAYVVNDVEAARHFLEKFNIEYKVEPDGQISVLESRDVDRERAKAVEARLRKVGLAGLCDHKSIWRDRENNTLVTYSPYDVESVKQTWIEKVEDNFYGHGTTTFIIRC